MLLKKSHILILIVTILCSSCNPFISRDLRRKNKCNRKLDRVVEKCPELAKTDTITITVPEIKIDTVVEVNIDTVVVGTIIKGLDTIVEYERRVEYLTKYITRAISIDTNIYEQGVLVHLNLFEGSLHVSIKKDPEDIKAPVQVITPIKLTVFEQFLNFLGGAWWGLFWLIIILSILYILYRKFLK